MQKSSSGSPVVGSVARLAVCYLACLVAFLMISVLAYMIPTSPMEANLRESADQLEQEGLYRQAIVGGAPWSVDNYTVAIMLNEAAHGAGDPVRGAMLNPLTTDGEDPIVRLANGIGIPDDLIPTGYAQYWHGYLALLKPLLLLADLARIRGASIVLFTCLLGVVTMVLARRDGILSGLALIAAFAVFNYTVMIESLSLAACAYIALGASCLVLWQAGRGRRLLPDASPWWAAPFFVVGALTAYFDFLCTPVITLGIPLALLAYLSRDEVRRGNVTRCLLGVLALCLCWAAGYAGLWVSKWVVATLVTGQDVVATGLGKVTERSSALASGAGEAIGISRLQAIMSNVRNVLPGASLWAFAALVLVAAVVVACLSARSRKGTGWWWVIPLAAVSLLPYAWYVFAANHSYQHAFFTYRCQLVTFICLGLVLSGAVRAVRGAGAGEPCAVLRARGEHDAMDAAARGLGDEGRLAD